MELIYSNSISQFIMILLYISLGDLLLISADLYSSCVTGHKIFVNYCK
jgi:hypothetical protein